jgi:hypothetical protein
MEEFVPLTPINFFQIHVDCFQSGIFPSLQGSVLRKHLLPDLSSLCSDYPFAKVALGWNRQGIEAHVQVSQPYQRSSFPDLTRGDSVELFFDTRDVKTAVFNTKFCHHFYFLPEAIEGNIAGEMTRFRTEDRHELCDSRELIVKSSLKSSSYSMQIFIPSNCLYGYEPDQFDRLGFAYRINRPQSAPQHFTVVSQEYQIDQQPSLWGSLKLVK